MAGGSNTRLLSNTIKGRGAVFGVVVVCLFCSAAFGQYCSASGGCGYEYISDVQVGTINNTGTGCDNYTDYTHLLTMMEIGTGYTITVTNGNPDEESQCGIWIDWNADSDFNDAEEAIAVAGTPGLGPYTATITPPAGAALGDTRMRIRIRYTGTLSPCGTTSYGEVEDYTITVAEAGGKYGGGSGTAEDPYQIRTPSQMNTIGTNRGDWDKHFILCADINVGGYTGTSFNIIGLDLDHAFTGVFDGNGHTISNFTYITSGTNGIGLFRFVDGPGAEIKNLGLIDPDVDGGSRDRVGALVGEMGDEGSISNCYLEGGSVSGNWQVGGLVGRNLGTIRNCSSNASISGNGAYYNVGGLVGTGGTITDCHSSGSVSGNGPYGGYAGGLVGTGGIITNCYSSASVSVGGDFCPAGGLVGSGGRITNCYATGSVSGTGDYSESIGGLAGVGGTITNCYATGSVSGPTRVGGLVGSGGIIHNCYSTGSVSGTGGAVGGLVGTGGTVYDSFWDIETSGQATSAGGTGLTTAQMKDANTYLYWGGCGVVWTIDDGVDYPHLIWEGMPGQIISAQLSDFVAGAGTETSPYLIYTAEELNLIGLFWCEWDKHFKLMADIDLAGYTGRQFNIIASTLDNAFSGVFDGNGRTISNFTYSSTVGYIGLFRYVDGPGAEIKDLGLIDPNVNKGAAEVFSGPSYVGSLAAVLEDGTISGCYAEGGSVSGNVDVGGLVGDSNGIISNCYSTASVSGIRSNVGGLAGQNWGTITNCYSTGSVSTRGLIPGPAGGLVGDNHRTITNCYSEGDVSGRDRVGGLAGGNSGTITNCYSTGSISGSSNSVGGLAGDNGGTITNCYSLGTSTGTAKVGGLVGENGDTITNCYSSGGVLGENYVGGLAGWNDGAVSNCYATGSVSGTTNVGGLVGLNNAMVNNCYATGSVSGDEYAGGLLGTNDAEISGSFWDIETSGRSNMCGSQVGSGSGCDDGNGKRSPEMRTQGTFTSAGWDFFGESTNGTDDIWRLCDDGTNYTMLSWQFPLADFICPDGVEMYDLRVLCEQWLLEELSWDVGPDGGDGIVNFLDWAIFADGWQTTHDIFDLAEFADQWLKAGSNYLIADIAPPADGDGIVNMRDFAALANNWLLGVGN